MDSIYSTAKVCPKPEECWALEPGKEMLYFIQVPHYGSHFTYY